MTRSRLGWRAPGALALATLMGPAALSAQDGERPLPERPAPAGYHTLAEIDAHLQRLASGTDCTLETIARTPEGRAVQVLAFGNPAAGKPALLVVANPDGDRLVGSEMALAFTRRLAAGSSLLERANVYVVVVPNPDATARAFNGELARRGSGVDEDRDGRIDEDAPDDLDGDGRALWMRVPDPTGGHRVGENDARASEAADKAAGEAPEFELLREGRDDDGDRTSNEDGLGGIRYEANWPHRWREHQRESGPYALSEPETRGLARFVLDHPEIVMAVVFGAEDNLAATPSGADTINQQSTQPRKADAAVIKRLGERRYAESEFEKPESGDHGHGTLADWLYFQAGILTLESAAWAPDLSRGEVEATDDDDDEAEKPELTDEEKWIRWNDVVLGGAGFADWTPAEHPELGAVQVGGWLPLVRTNAPAEQLRDLSQEWADFLESLGGELPQLVWRDVSVEAKGGGVYEARATLANLGAMPTISSMGARVRRARQLEVRLALPEGAVLLAGSNPQRFARLDGLGDHREMRWVYRLPDRARSAPKLVATSQTAGEAVHVLAASQEAGR